MQLLNVDFECFSARIGDVGMVSMPSDHVPRRIDWSKWIDCTVMSGVVMGSSGAGSLEMKTQGYRQHNAIQYGSGRKFIPRINISPDHSDPKENFGPSLLQNQQGLDQVELLNGLNEIADLTKFLMVGSWVQSVPSWITSMNAVFAAKYLSYTADVLDHQITFWNSIADRLENRNTFLVSDDVGRLSSLSATCRTWRNRLQRSKILVEQKGQSWFAAAVNGYSTHSLDGETVKIYRSKPIDPEHWCGSPRFNYDFKDVKSEFSENLRPLQNSREIWVSTPGVGLSLWLADQLAPIAGGMERYRLPSSILGWHPLRDVVAFLALGTSGSIFYLVDRNSMLQIFQIDRSSSHG